MYLQKAGGIFRGLDDNAVFVGGRDDNPVFVGEYTHTGNYTPANHGDDKLMWVSGMGEYTHMGSDSKKDELKLTQIVGSLSATKLSQLLTDAAALQAFAKQQGYSGVVGLKKVLLKEQNKRAAGAGGGGGSGSGAAGLLASISPAKVVIGVLVIGGGILAAKKLSGR